MSFKFYIVDAFVNPEKRFSGNPAAVVILDSDNDISDEKKQLIAGQFNLSETVFVSRLEDQFLIRWFTPTHEVELCGHATMAASYVLCTQATQYSDTIAASAPIKYRTKFGLYLQTTFDGTFLTLNFPLNEPVPVGAVAWLEPLKQAVLGDGHSTELIVDAALAPNRYMVMRLQDGADIGQVQPDFNRMQEIDCHKKVDLLIVTQKSNHSVTGQHFISRVFAPWLGVSEDPVTGSAFTVLAPYWSMIYQNELKQPVTVFTALQASKRSGVVRSELLSPNRVLISGQAAIFSSGTFDL